MYGTVYDVVVVTLTRVPSVVGITATVLIIYSAYRLRAAARKKRGAWPAIFTLVALYSFVAALAPGGWDEALVLLGIGFAALACYIWLDPERTTPSASGTETSEGRGWFG